MSASENTPTVAQAVEAIEALGLTPAAETEAPEAPVTLADLIQEVNDGSRIAEGQTAEGIADEIAKQATNVKSAFTRVTNAYKAMARTLAEARTNVLRPDGSPDWAGETATWKAIARIAYDSTFQGLAKAERDKVMGAVRQHLNRTFLEPAIRAYVASAVTLDGEKLYPDEESMGSEAFLLAVRRQYKDAGLAVPSRYQTPEDKANSGSGGGPGNGPATTVEAVLKGIEGLDKVKPSLASKGALRAVSGVVASVAKGGNIEGRQSIAADLERIYTLSAYALKCLDRKAGPKDHEQVASLFWGTDDAQAPQEDSEQ